LLQKKTRILPVLPAVIPEDDLVEAQLRITGKADRKALPAEHVYFQGNFLADIKLFAEIQYLDSAEKNVPYAQIIVFAIVNR